MRVETGSKYFVHVLIIILLIIIIAMLLMFNQKKESFGIEYFKGPNCNACQKKYNNYCIPLHKESVKNGSWKAQDKECKLVCNKGYKEENTFCICDKIKNENCDFEFNVDDDLKMQTNGVDNPPSHTLYYKSN